MRRKSKEAILEVETGGGGTRVFRVPLALACMAGKRIGENVYNATIESLVFCLRGLKAPVGQLVEEALAIQRKVITQGMRLPVDAKLLVAQAKTVGVLINDTRLVSCTKLKGLWEFLHNILDSLMDRGICILVLSEKGK